MARIMTATTKNEFEAEQEVKRDQRHSSQVDGTIAVLFDDIWREIHHAGGHGESSAGESVCVYGAELGGVVGETGCVRDHALGEGGNGRVDGKRRRQHTAHCRPVQYECVIDNRSVCPPVCHVVYCRCTVQDPHSIIVHSLIFFTIVRKFIVPIYAEDGEPVRPGSEMKRISWQNIFKTRRTCTSTHAAEMRIGGKANPSKSVNRGTIVEFLTTPWRCHAAVEIGGAREIEGDIAIWKQAFFGHWCALRRDR